MFIGEGSGVARSFYTALAEALLAGQPVPNLEAAQVQLAKLAYHPIVISLNKIFNTGTVRYLEQYYCQLMPLLDIFSLLGNL
jgi:hypothetical protein